jgi:predicted esterase
MNLRRLWILVSLALITTSAFAQLPKATYLFAHRDTCDLYLDIYPPAPESQTSYKGHEKPTILYVFGGGFISGSRDAKAHDPWFKILTDNGYGVVSVDYRLGLKGVEMKFDLFHLTASAKNTKRAVDIGVEDVFDAIRFLAEHRSTLGIDTDNLVIAGSSAGAMISLSSAWETCTPTERTALLPEGFRFKGVMSFAGAVMSSSGLPVYGIAPPPQLLIHGIDDKIVNYNKMALGRWGLFGSKSLVDKVFAKQGFTYSIYRYVGHTHEMASHMVQTWDLQKRFLEKCVMAGQAVVIDETIDDPAMPTWKNFTLNDLYKK